MKITFVTFHNWETKRIGGFHKFAEACADAGHEVVFFSFARPYYIKFKNEERLNGNILKMLSKGKEYFTSKGNKVTNCTWPTIRIPMPFYKYMPQTINHWLNTHSFGSFKHFQECFLSGTDVFVIESCEGVFLYDKLKRYNPSSKFVYRPSDPIMIDGASQYAINMETRLMNEADLVLIVNEVSRLLYKSKTPNFEEKVNYKVLSNGVDIELFLKTYDKPDLLKKNNTALYVGAREVEWDLLVYAAEKCPNYNFICVCPESPSYKFLHSNLPNLYYIPGVSPADVPKYVTNCDVIIVPNPSGEYKLRPWGVTAKYYQAFASNKPIVAYDDIEELKQYGVLLSYDYDTFVDQLKLAMEERIETNYKLDDKSWESITKQFRLHMESLFI